MKTIISTLLPLWMAGFLMLTFTANLRSQSNIQQPLSVNSDGSAAHATAQLDVSATDKGMLVPRMTSAQRTGIASPATGLLVYDTTTGGFWFYNGTAWQNLSTQKVLADADNDTKVQVEENADEDIIRFDVGGTEGMLLVKNASNVPRLELPDGSSSVYIGDQAGASITSATNNIALGSSALSNTTIGGANTAIGATTLTLNTSGNNNTAVGFQSMFSNTSGQQNTAAGRSSMHMNTDGFLNAAFGYQSLFSNASGTANSAFGAHTLRSSTTAVSNTAVGFECLYSNTTGHHNTAVGTAALRSNTSGISNVGIGRSALFNNTIQSNIVAVGDSSLFNNQSTSNTAIGSKALFTNTSGSGNTATGFKSLFSNSTASSNTAFGAFAMEDNTTGGNNTAVGESALRNNLSGPANTAVGSVSLLVNTTGNNNTAIGFQSMVSNVGGQENSALGRSSLHFNTAGTNNTAVGFQSLFSNTNGNFNTAIGHRAMETNASGVVNTVVGAFADVAADGLSNATAIGFRAEAAASNSLVLGSINGVNGATNSVKVGIGDNAPSHFLTVKSADSETVRLYSTGVNGAGARLNFGDGDFVFIEEPEDDEMQIRANRVGISRNPTTNTLEVEGNASKTAAGDWLANSDARLKKNITPLNSQEMLKKLLSLQGVTYEWNDEKTGSKRPEGIQYGFTAQNISEVFPTLVETDKLGFLQTAYGTYDAMTVEAIRALNDKIAALEAHCRELSQQNSGQKSLIDLQQKQLETQAAALDKITTALIGAGIAVEK
jgi:hypothetical protein